MKNKKRAEKKNKENFVKLTKFSGEPFENSFSNTEQKVNHHLQVMNKALALSFRSASPSPLQTYTFRCRFKSEGLGDTEKVNCSNGSEQKVYKSQKISNINILPGNLQGLPDDYFSEDTLIFIDAGFLSKLSKYFGNGKYLFYDLIKFSENLSRKQKLKCKKIFYYTAPPFQSLMPTKEEEIKKEGYDRFVQKLRDKGVIVREGRCQRLKIDGKFVFGQKGVDSLVIIDLMAIPLEYQKVKKIILIANDSDFVPVVLKLNQLGIEVILYTYYSKKRESSFARSNELLKSVSRYVQLIKEDFLNAPLKKDEKKF